MPVGPVAGTEATVVISSSAFVPPAIATNFAPSSTDGQLGLSCSGTKVGSDW